MEGIGDLTAFPFVNPEGVESLGLGLEGVRSRRPCAAPHSDTVEAKTLLRAPHHPGLGAHGDACGGLSPGIPPPECACQFLSPAFETGQQYLEGP